MNRVIQRFLPLLLLMLVAWTGHTQDFIRPGLDQVGQAPSEQRNSPVLSTAPPIVFYEDYVIGPGDLLEIKVFQVEELNTTVRVGITGSITLPLLGQVQVSDLTPLELQQKISNRLSEKYLKDPQITIFIKEFQNQPISVIGSVEKPGVYQLTTRKNLIEMLSLAGGLSKKSSTPSGRTVSITRESGFGDLTASEGLEILTPKKISIELRKLLYTQESHLNVQVKARDIITVSKADVVYVVGAVKQPGGFVLEDEETVTVLQALAMARGFDKYPKKGAARIIRRLKDGSRQEFPVRLGKVLNGKALDPTLLANDILFVPSSKIKGGALRGAEAVVSVVSGLIVWRR